jgi:hypothetical protein
MRIILIFLFGSISLLRAQNYTFNFPNNGSRVCLASSEVDLLSLSVTILLLDSDDNSAYTTHILRRPFGMNNQPWTSVAEDIPAGTASWIDTNVQLGEVWEYQIRRADTWSYDGVNYDAIGYTIGSLNHDQTGYRGQMILLIADNIVELLPEKINRLKFEFEAEGWKVNEVVVPKATDWDSGSDVVGIRNQIAGIYNNAPSEDKPRALFILGHVPLPRCGSTDAAAPDEHNENKGARGCDCYYADIDGVFTDNNTYNPGGLSTTLAINLPGDYKWDQDFFASHVEMAFGRIDFTDLTDYNTGEIEMTENYLDRLSVYKNVSPGYFMGNKSAFYFGYDNSNDGSYRSLPNISSPDSTFQNYTNLPHPQWVEENGPFMIYMQNLSVPDTYEWETYGMNATVFSSDQSYWGWGDVPQDNSIYSRIRSLLVPDSKCLITLWTTTGINIFHQSCMGEPFGLSLLPIMNHNSTNNILEKAPQYYDTEEWWNRSHFALFGDPTLRLHQVIPPGVVTTYTNGNVATVNWLTSADTRQIGYHIYKKSASDNSYQKISDNLVTDLSFVDNNYTSGDDYLVKTIIHQVTGCGSFINASIGRKGEIIAGINDFEKHSSAILIYPNPASETIYIINKSQENNKLEVYDSMGRSVLQIHANSGKIAEAQISSLADGCYVIRDQRGMYISALMVVR